MNIKDITITSLETISAFSLTTGNYRFTLDELQNRWMTLSGIDGGWSSYEYVKQQRAIRKRERLKAKKEKMEEQNNGKSE